MKKSPSRMLKFYNRFAMCSELVGHCFGIVRELFGKCLVTIGDLYRELFRNLFRNYFRMFSELVLNMFGTDLGIV